MYRRSSLDHGAAVGSWGLAVGGGDLSNCSDVVDVVAEEGEEGGDAGKGAGGVKG